MREFKCKICRRAGVKLFLKGERCYSTKCSVVRRAYPPGMKGKRRKSPLSEYGKELSEKQKLKNWYNLNERQLKNYVKSIMAKKGSAGNAAELLIKTLEWRMDNVVFRLGFSPSRNHAQQLVSHGFFLINGKAIDTPSHEVKKGDVVTPRPQKIKKTVFQNIKTFLKKYKQPSWLQMDVEKLEGKIIGDPTLQESAPPAEVSAIFEFYSR